MNIEVGEVWLVKFPLEEDVSVFKNRPVVVLDVEMETLQVLSVKVTKHPPRPNDKYDVPILYWQEAKLKISSTARVSKTMYLEKDMFIHKIGDLHPEDFNKIKNKFIQLLQERIHSNQYTAATKDIDKENESEDEWER